MRQRIRTTDKRLKGNADEEAVNHPLHYGGDVPHETWKCLHAWGLETDALLWNVVKYISRAGRKASLLEDLKKAQWYLNKRIELLEFKREKECQNSSTGANSAASTTGPAAVR